MLNVHRSISRAWAFAFCCAAPCAALAQVFSQPAFTYDAEFEQEARTIDTTSGLPVCSQPWSIQFDAQSAPIDLDQVFGSIQGGCPLVVLKRRILAGSFISPTAASLSLLSRISASASSEIASFGTASGFASSNMSARINLSDWTIATVSFDAAANSGLVNAQSVASAQFHGPLDPLTDTGVVFAEAWSGATSYASVLSQVLLPPGTYELRLSGVCSFAATIAPEYLARSQATVLFNSLVPGAPPPELDLNADGLVTADDACLWVKTPTDANGDGNITQDDLLFLMGIARAGGSTVTDSNNDGLPDQCACPADWNADGNLDFFDIVAYLGQFASGDLATDLTGDGFLDFFDLLNFLGLFSGGCPVG